MWIALSMSVRRAIDAGDNPWAGLFVLVPLFNLVVMLALCIPPSATHAEGSERTIAEAGAKSATALATLRAGTIGVLVGGLYAVVVIQAPGRSGSPSRGHRSMAFTKASWTASSARSQSPYWRMSVATARPDSSRKRRSTTSGVTSTVTRQAWARRGTAERPNDGAAYPAAASYSLRKRR